jgi:hypothetical protein
MGGGAPPGTRRAAAARRAVGRLRARGQGGYLPLEIFARDAARVREPARRPEYPPKRHEMVAAG